MIDNDRRNEKMEARVHFSKPLLFLLIFSIFLESLFYFVGNGQVYRAIQLIMVIIGIIIIVFGTFYDFGANSYVESIFVAKAKLSEEDVIQIHREQIIMTLIYIGLGILYIAAAYILSFVFSL